MAGNRKNHKKPAFQLYMDGLPLASKHKPPLHVRHASAFKWGALGALIVAAIYLFQEPGPELPLPANGTVTWSQNRPGPTAPFKFEASKTDTSQNYYVRLVEKHSGQAVVSLFVRGGQDAFVNAPVGEYRVIVAEGDTWYGDKHYFGRGTSVTEGLKTIELTYDPRTRGSMGHVVSYTKRLDGNYPTRQTWRSELK